MVAHFLFKETASTNWKLILALAFVFIVHVWHALYINANVPSQGSMLSDILPKSIYFIKLISTSLYRIVIPNFKPQSQLLVNLIAVLALSISIWITIKSISDKSKRNLIVLSLMGLIVSSVVLTLTRYNQTEIHYYYSTLQLPFILLILAVYLDHYFIKKIKYIQWVLPLIVTIFLFLDFKGKSIFVKRNKLNKQQMESGLSVNQYKPFDDPCFEMDDYFNVGQHTESESAIILYKWLGYQDTFHPHEDK